jgi:hypothetical protein
LAANKHSSTDPEVTAVTIILNKLPAAAENIGQGLLVTWRGFDLRLAFADRFFAAIINYAPKGSGAFTT